MTSSSLVSYAFIMFAWSAAEEAAASSWNAMNSLLSTASLTRLTSSTFLIRKISSRSNSSNSDSMYLIVFFVRGMTTLSKAFTRRLVTLMASSRAKKEVCREASWIKFSNKVVHFLVHFSISLPPRARPYASAAAADWSVIFSNTGKRTPATLSFWTRTRMRASIGLSISLYLNLESAAQTASASENDASFISSPIELLVE
mmetsp:Transcript_21315/g.31217  ORF Transcript_21315/g.31217 Transcript_21315/m.31217 type:complete len:201 (+) Transcript_21315:59-661(+)